ncbi:MAG: mannose-1-phosphate guanylyltransferase [Thermoguttaceae bacterium]
MLHAVVLAGGAGSRLWPESQADRPKQFLRLFGQETLIANTVQRISSIVPQDRVLFATRDSFVPLLRESFPTLSPQQLLLEPVARNTAPCIGLAAIRLLRDDPDATMIVLPSDQRIEPESEFCRILRFAGQQVEESPNRLVTLGVRPRFPSTAYGYIERGQPVAEKQKLSEQSSVCEKRQSPIRMYQVQQFHEKPVLNWATEFVESGRFFWNAGIFIWKARTILEEIRTWGPDLGERLDRIAKQVVSPQFPSILAKEFQEMKSISIDYAVLEHSSNVFVIETDFDWDDVGTWSSLARVYTDCEDELGNVSLGGVLHAKDARNNLVRSTDPNREIALIGVDNLIIVQTARTTLIVPKEQEGAIPVLLAELAGPKG